MLLGNNEEQAKERVTVVFTVNAKASGFEGGALAGASLDAQHDGKRSPEAEGEDGLQAGYEHQQASHRYDEGQLHRACHT